MEKQEELLEATDKPQGSCNFISSIDRSSHWPYLPTLQLPALSHHLRRPHNVLPSHGPAQCQQPVAVQSVRQGVQ